MIDRYTFCRKSTLRRITLGMMEGDHLNDLDAFDAHFLVTASRGALLGYIRKEQDRRFDRLASQLHEIGRAIREMGGGDDEDSMTGGPFGIDVDPEIFGHDLAGLGGDHSVSVRCSVRPDGSIEFGKPATLVGFATHTADAGDFVGVNTGPGIVNVKVNREVLAGEPVTVDDLEEERDDPPEMRPTDYVVRAAWAILDSAYDQDTPKGETITIVDPDLFAKLSSAVHAADPLMIHRPPSIEEEREAAAEGK